MSGTTSDDRKPLIGEHAVRSSWAGSDPVSLSEEQEESIVGWRRRTVGPQFLVDHIKRILTEEGFAAFTLHDRAGGLKSGRARDLLSRWAEGLQGLSRRDAGLNNNDGSPLIQADVVTLSGITPSDKKPLISVNAVHTAWARADPVVLSEDEEKLIIGWRRGVGGRQFLVEHIVDVLRDEERSARFMLRDGSGALKSPSARDVVWRWAKGLNGFSRREAGLDGVSGKDGYPLAPMAVVRLSGITPSDKKPLISETIVRDSWRAADPVVLSEAEEKAIVGWRRRLDGPQFLVEHIVDVLRDEERSAQFMLRNGLGALKSPSARDVIWQWAKGLSGENDDDGSPLTGEAVAALSGYPPSDNSTLISGPTVYRLWRGVKEREAGGNEVGAGRGDQPTGSGSEPALHPVSAPLGVEESASWSGPPQTPMSPAGTHDDPSASDPLVIDAVDEPSERGADPGMDPGPEGQGAGVLFPASGVPEGNLAGGVLIGHQPAGHHP
ncbi:hypothetical protein, partial [Lentzea sp. NPDC004782]|uniref:hypothetical protein n=1 Tax=Lentzea sp. NPDC004782 TaxID=3154458 RepID=UPI0033AE66D4